MQKRRYYIPKGGMFMSQIRDLINAAKNIDGKIKVQNQTSEEAWKSWKYRELKERISHLIRVDAYNAKEGIEYKIAGYRVNIDEDGNISLTVTELNDKKMLGNAFFYTNEESISRKKAKALAKEMSEFISEATGEPISVGIAYIYLKSKSEKSLGDHLCNWR